MGKPNGWVLVCSALVVTIALAGPLMILDAQQTGNEIPAPTIRVSTRLVLVDVIATDKQGHTITDLKPDDFIVEENGKKQKVATFVPPTTPESAIPPIVAPGLYTNRPDFRSPGGPPTVILLDAANASFKDQAYGRLQMLKYVQEQLKPGQRIAVFTLTDRLQMIQDFTSDPKVLQDALQRYRPQEQIMQPAAPPPASAGVSGSDLGPAAAAQLAVAANEIASFTSAQVAYVEDIRVRNTLEGMRALGRALGGLPGRKEVIWMTAAFPFDLIPSDRNVSEAEMSEVTQGIQQMSLGTRAAGSMAQHFRQSYYKDIQEAAAELSNAQVAIYPVDVRGLMSGMEGAAIALPSHTSDTHSANPGAAMDDLVASQETMREIAAETGGKAYVNQNEIKQGVAVALADNNAAYTIGYYPENKKWDSRYRNIKIKVAREGIQLRHRKGYFAVDPTLQKDRKEDQAVAEALRTNVPATLVTFSARAKKTDTGKLGVDFLIDAHTLSTEDASGGGKKFNFTYYAAVFSPEGKIITNRSMKVDQAFNADTYQQILQHGIMLHMDVDTTPTPNQQLRLVVRDERTGFVGSTVGPLVTQ